MRFFLFIIFSQLFINLGAQSFQVQLTNNLQLGNTVSEIYDSNIESKTNYLSGTGFTVGLSIKWPLSNTLFFQSGLSATCLHQEVEHQYIYDGYFNHTPLTPPLLFNITSEIPTSQSGHYYTFENKKQQVFFIEIPAKISFDINPKFGIAIGPIVRTPISSSHKTTYREFDIKINELTLSGNTEGDEAIDKSGIYFKDFGLLAESEFYYAINSFGISFSCGKYMTNVYEHELNARPFSFRIKLFYEIMNKNSE